MPTALDKTSAMITRHSDVVLAAGVMGILITLIVPLPTPVLDVLLTLNFAYVLLLLMVVLAVNSPLELSTFPSLLLIGTLFRLSLNVASTRLILLNAFAGKLIQSFGEFVVGGQMVVGLIIFLILIVIQFIVITKGAERISEVGARFTLDAMPGKQMSIDADLSAGLIDEHQARRRREEIVQEADFYGAMDGASKYVRGDAIASIIVVLINILGGIVIGLGKSMTVGEAIKTYSLLTVGDGLVTQIPALIMSTTAGILITKSASDQGLSHELGVQIFAKPRAVAIASVVILGFAFMPGLPMVPFLLLGLCLSGAYFAVRNRQRAAVRRPAQSEQQAKEKKESEQDMIQSLLEPDRIAVEVGYNLIQLIDPKRGGTLLERIKALRSKFARELGIVVPKIRILDNVELEANTYRVKLSGHKVAEGQVRPGWLMAMKPDGEPTPLRGLEGVDPYFGLPVIWCRRVEKETAVERGFTVVDAESVFITHLSEVLRHHAHEILCRQDVRQMLDNIKKDNAVVVDELIPDVLSLAQLQQVLQRLLQEAVPINNLSYILEKLGNYAAHVKDPATLTELLRRSLARAICARFSDEDDTLHVLTIDPHLEEEMRDSVQVTDGEARLNLPPARIRALVASVSEQLQAGCKAGAEAVILTDARLRPHLRRIFSRVLSDVPVISYDEVAEGFEVKTIGVVASPDADLAYVAAHSPRSEERP